jgi:hypothetical protein
MSATWPKPWAPIEHASERSLLEIELKRELGELHSLYGLPAVALARRHDRDNVLFEINDGRVAEIHLTWRKSRESDPRWPTTRIYESISTWIRERMRSPREE